MRLTPLLLLLAAPLAAQTPWEAYVEYPTPQNAAKVQAATYSDSLTETDSARSAHADRLEHDLDLLEVQVEAGDREAIRLAFRLFPELGGEYAERLDEMVGRLIRINPVVFLQETLRATGGKWCLGMNDGDPYVDRPRASEYERLRRIEALKSVTNSELRLVRDKCIAALGAGN
jgi:hypothetical protein